MHREVCQNDDQNVHTLSGILDVLTYKLLFSEGFAKVIKFSINFQVGI